MNLFFHPNPSETLVLSEEESMHAVKVLRLKEGETILLLDGKGNKYEAVITKAAPKKCAFSISTIHTETKKRTYRLHMAVAPTKSIDRTEWWVEKAIEIGIDEISFLQCERSERKNLNLERIEKIAISALKQSMNLHLPKLNPLTSFTDFIAAHSSTPVYMAHLGTGERRLFKNEIVSTTAITLLIGPEGDFSAAEIKLAQDRNIIAVSLGDSRLRTETAALAGCFICHTLKN
jgi:16S rRNA (uracil1498-N3)-methyltransferase